MKRTLLSKEFFFSPQKFPNFPPTLFILWTESKSPIIEFYPFGLNWKTFTFVRRRPLQCKNDDSFVQTFVRVSLTSLCRQHLHSKKMEFLLNLSFVNTFKSNTMKRSIFVILYQGYTIKKVKLKQLKRYGIVLTLAIEFQNI